MDPADDRRLLEFQVVGLAQTVTDPSWWRQVKHPLYPDTKNAMAFVDACEAAAKVTGDVAACEQRQWDELKQLVEWTVKRAEETEGSQAL